MSALMREEKKLAEFLSKLVRKFWNKLLGADKPKKRDTKTNGYYLNLFFIGVVLFHVAGSLINQLEFKGDFGTRYTGFLTLNLIGIYFASQGLMKLYRRAKNTVSKLREFSRDAEERELIKSIRKARRHKAR